MPACAVLTPALDAGTVGASDPSPANLPPRKRLGFQPGAGGFCPAFAVGEARRTRAVSPFAPKKAFPAHCMPPSRFYRRGSAPGCAQQRTGASGREPAAMISESLLEALPPSSSDASSPLRTSIHRGFGISFMPKSVRPRSALLRETLLRAHSPVRPLSHGASTLSITPSNSSLSPPARATRERLELVIARLSRRCGDSSRKQPVTPKVPNWL